MSRKTIKLRDSNRKLKEAAPKPGAVTFSAEDAKAFEEYKAFGSLEDCKKTKTERDEFHGQIETGNRVKVRDQVAGIAKFKPSVLGDLADKDGVTFVVKEGEDPRTKKKVPQAFIKGEGDALTPIEQYATEKWGDYIPALRLESEKPTPNGTPPRARSMPAPGATPTRHRAEPL